MDRRAFLILGLSLSACATLRPPEVGVAPEPFAELEPVYGLEATRDGIVVYIRADGCTPSDDYVPYVDRRSDPATLSIARRRIRTCPGAELGYLALNFPWSVLGLRGGQRMILLNPVLSLAR